MADPSYVERFSLHGRTALITGGSKGIGAVAARVLAEAGADLAIVGRDRADLDATQAAVSAMGRRCLVIEADLATVSGARAAAATALSHFRVVDVLVNNAGITHLHSLVETPAEAWDEIQAVNLRAPFLLAQALAPKMIEQRRGKIVNVSSLAGSVGLVDHAAYCASKGGLNLLTKVMAAEWAQYNIQANAVSPTVIMTPMGELAWGDPTKSEPMLAKIPLGRFGKPVEVADVILFLSSSASDMICGEVIMVDGGYSAT
jgi:2-deoxy-D-gluconate 3-dehydrogenase